MTADIATSFSAAGAHFTKISPLLWEPPGQSLAFALDLTPGEQVLDVCCGAGSSAIPAALAVGPSGRVDAVDLAAGLLERGRATAAARGLANIEFHQADATTWERPGYDVLSSSFGVFFLPGMDAAVTRLLGLLRPGGRFGLTVWPAQAHKPNAEILFGIIERHRGSAIPQNPMKAALDRLDSSAKLAGWLTGLGTRDVRVRTLSNLIPATSDFVWSHVLGSGWRALLDGFSDDEITAIGTEYVSALAGRGVTTLNATTLVGTAAYG